MGFITALRMCLHELARLNDKLVPPLSQRIHILNGPVVEAFPCFVAQLPMVHHFLQKQRRFCAGRQTGQHRLLHMIAKIQTLSLIHI